jgi:hypothetical protein
VEAAEFLLECNRVGWSSYGCQAFLADYNGCGDPATILVDPDQGYSCGPDIPDAKTVEATWHVVCGRVVNPADPGADPCARTDFTSDGRVFIPTDDICGSTISLIDPDSGACIAELRPFPLRQQSVQDLIAFGLGKFGGPIIVIPQRGPVTGPGDPVQP